MGIFDAFKSNPAPQAPAQQPAQPATTPTEPGAIPNQSAPATQQTPVTDVNGVVPAGQPAPAEPKDDSPLAEFNTLWDTAPVDPNNPTPQEPAPLTADQVQKVVAKADFSKVITPENLTAIAAGGEDAQKAFAVAMNAVAQQVMVQSTMVNNKLTEKAVADALKKHTENLPAELRRQAAADHLKTSNPLFDNPAVKPVIAATQQKLLEKFPNATHEQITEMTQNYIVAMGEAFTPKAAVTDNGLGEQDWTNFLEE